MSQMSLGFQALYMTHECKHWRNMADCAFWYKPTISQCELTFRNRTPHSRINIDKTCQLTGTVRGPARRPHFSLVIISVTVQLWTQVFWVISVYFNIRNTLPKSDTFLLGHPVYIYIHTKNIYKYIEIYKYIYLFI